MTTTMRIKKFRLKPLVFSYDTYKHVKGEVELKAFKCTFVVFQQIEPVDLRI